ASTLRTPTEMVWASSARATSTKPTTARSCRKRHLTEFNRRGRVLQWGPGLDYFDVLFHSQRRLHGVEQISDADAQAQGNAVQRLDRRGILAQLDLRQIAERHVG